MINRKGIRKLMIDQDITFGDISEILGLSYSSVQKKIGGQTSMSLSEAEKLQDLFSIADCDFAFYFLGRF